MKLDGLNPLDAGPRRSPHGERGLKLEVNPHEIHPTKSLPSRGAWIEIASRIEGPVTFSSLPSRGAWIEIISGGDWTPYAEVAPLTGSVD